jgi:uncharacterized Zn finger protein/DNA-binding protein H-NS
MSFAWKPYVSVADRRKKAEREIAKLRTKGHIGSPVVIQGRKLATTFWGQAWGDNLESYSDYENRLPRGRTYVRNGSVVDLQVNGGEINAKVMGSALYKVVVKVAPLPRARWSSICNDCAGSIDSLVELLQGRLSKAVMERVCQQETGLFPAPSEITLSCSCPDWASMCKHVEAVLYGIGARLDEHPELVFKLRAVDHADLVASAVKGRTLVTKAPASAKVLDGDDLSALFGLEMGDFLEREPEPKTQARPMAPHQESADKFTSPTIEVNSLKDFDTSRRRKSNTNVHKENAPCRGPEEPNEDVIAFNDQTAIQEVRGSFSTRGSNTTKRRLPVANRIGDSPTPIQNSSMATLLQLQKQMSQLQSELERVRRAEAHTVIARMQKDIATYGINAEDLGFVPATSTTPASPSATPAAKKTRGPGLKKTVASAPVKKAPAAAKFRDPKSGKTWNGHGKPPLWIAGKKDRTLFLIAALDASPMIADEQVSAPVKKASKSVVAKRATRRAAPTPVGTSSALAHVPAKKAVAKKTALNQKVVPAKKGAAVARKAAQAPRPVAKKTPAKKLASKSAAKTASASARGKAPKVNLSKAALALSQPAADATQGTLALDISAA